MILSHSSDYAIRALTEIVLRSDGLSVSAGSQSRFILCESLCRRAYLPREYVAKIFSLLANATILGSKKGLHGGFVLAKPAREISLLSIIEALDGDDQIDWCVVRSAKCNDCTPCHQHGLFKPLRQHMRNYLQTTTLADTASYLQETRPTDSASAR